MKNIKRVNVILGKEGEIIFNIKTKLTDISKTQSGFRNGLRTRKVLLPFNLFIQRYLGVKQNLNAFASYTRIRLDIKTDKPRLSRC